MTTQTPNQLATKQFFNSPSVKQKFEELLGKNAPSFITSVLQIVNSNALLQKAEPASVFNAAATAATLNLPINNNLGFAYIVPYGNKAQFQLGYKGFIQLAQRSGQFQKISATPIYEGQVKSADPLTGYEFDFTKRDSNIVIGYAAYFRLLNGFEATLYMTVDEVKAHGQKYSKTFKNGTWQTDFDAMATKTVIKLLLSRYAPLSIDMQKAIVSDQAVINDYNTSDVTYIDAGEMEVNKEAERLQHMIEDCTTVDELMKLEPNVKALNDEATTEIYKQKAGSF